MRTETEGGYIVRSFGDCMTGELKYKISFNAISLLLLTVISYFCVSLFYKVLNREITPQVTAEPVSLEAVPPPQNTKKPFAHYKSIIERNLFKTQKGI